jgi:pyruvate dehydrogenase E2 component (dihydrolipoamide acetyltransferase)
VTDGSIPTPPEPAPAEPAPPEAEAEAAPLPWRVRRPRSVAGFLSPAVRRVASERGIDPATLVARVGSGAHGRLALGDVEGAAVARPTGDERVPFNRVQVRAGAALLASTRTAAHALTIVSTDYSAVDVARRAWRERFRAEEGFSLTYLPFVARAVVDALRDYPLFNATMGDDALVVHSRVGLGIAVDLDHQGLVVPVVHDADSLSLRALARAIDDLARRARAKRLKPDDAVGGTFTLTNPGGYGTEISVPIINQPEVGILSTDGVRKRAVAAGGALAIRPTGFLCLSFDHRALDGAYAGAFASRVRAILEGRDWLTEM